MIQPIAIWVSLVFFCLLSHFDFHGFTYVWDLLYYLLLVHQEKTQKQSKICYYIISFLNEILLVVLSKFTSVLYHAA